MTGVVSVKYLGEENGVNRYKLTASDNLAEEIFFMASKNGWSLTDLHKEEINLESVFLDLTTKEAS